ncbi:MAG: hypothetical protein DRG58_11935 [Deltaproteobacteria bacterium]|nr:MAG: hypothetical protein DRG58_11935 [Deltaproteobacteria bacterium]
MAVKPGLKLHDLLFQLGNFSQCLVQGSFQKQDISLNFGRQLVFLRLRMGWTIEVVKKNFQGDYLSTGGRSPNPGVFLFGSPAVPFPPPRQLTVYQKI